MTEVGLTPPEEARAQHAAEEVFRVLTGDEPPPPPRRRVTQVIRDATLDAPLHALAVAFLLGVLIARRR